MTTELKKIKLQLKNALIRRNEKMIREAVKGDKSCAEIAKSRGLTRERFTQILAEAGVKISMKKGLKKYDAWRKNISLAKRKKK